MNKYQNYNPPTAVDIVVIVDDGNIKLEDRKVLLIERSNEPLGWALPGGFQEMGDTLERTVVKELLEETGLVLSEELFKLFGVTSDPKRDPRGHINSAAFFAIIPEEFKVVGGDDAKAAKWFKLSELPEKIVLGHREFIENAAELAQFGNDTELLDYVV